MLLLFSVRLAECLAVWEIAVHSVNFVNVYDCVYVLLSLLVLRVGCGI